MKYQQKTPEQIKSEIVDVIREYQEMYANVQYTGTVVPAVKLISLAKQGMLSTSEGIIIIPAYNNNNSKTILAMLRMVKKGDVFPTEIVT